MTGLEALDDRTLDEVTGGFARTAGGVVIGLGLAAAYSLSSTSPEMSRTRFANPSSCLGHAADKGSDLDKWFCHQR
jgi:hypothetical protein